jgi:hypothetical protein
MRVQQHVTELAIKGDDALSTLRPVEDTPSWATFDEDIEPDLSPTGSAPNNQTPINAAEVPEPRAEANGQHPTIPDPGVSVEVAEVAETDPWAEEERALAADHEDGEFDSTASVSRRVPAGLTNYDELTLPQLRARLRRFSLAELEELLSYERAHADRPSFVRMLTRRIGNVSKAAQDTQDNGDGSTSR